MELFSANESDSMENLHRISCLEENWDGYGAKTIPEKVISKVRESLRSLNRKSCISPTARGSIQMEFENSCKDYLEFEFFEDKIVAYREVGIHEEEFEINIKNIPKYLDEFFELVDIKNRIRVVRTKRTIIRRLRSKTKRK